MHVDTAESSVSSITNSNNKTSSSSDESSDISVWPTKTNNDHHKRKMIERIPSLPRKTSKSSSHSAQPVSIISSAEAIVELKTSDTDSSSPRQHCNKNQKLLKEDDEFAAGMDPATTEGQLALYPTLTEKAAKMAAKREYNRRNAARVRTRNKNMVAVLQEEVSCLTKRSRDLSRSNDLLTTQIEDLETQNKELRASRNVEEEHRSRGVNSLSSSNNNTVSQLLVALQNQNKRQQDTSIPHLLTRLTAGQHGGASNILPMLQSGLMGGASRQLPSARLQNSVASPPLPVRQAMQHQHLSHTLRALGAQHPQSQQFGQQPLSQDLTCNK